MSNLTDELELQLEHVLRSKRDVDSFYKTTRGTEYFYQEFAEWLVKKFVEEKYNAKTR